jgi:hypothetical protein
MRLIEKFERVFGAVSDAPPYAATSFAAQSGQIT